jgi:hypothetical protein
LGKRTAMSDARQAVNLRSICEETLGCAGVNERDAADVECRAWRNSDPIGHRIHRADIPRRNATPWETSPLPNREALTSGMCPHNGTRLIKDLAFAPCRSTLAQQAAVVAIWDEADLLALWLLCGDETT